MAAWLCELGATLVHNANAIAWKSADNLADLAPHRELDLGFEIACVFESDPTPGFGHLVHTRGLLNFGHPDFVLFGAHPRDARPLGLILNMLAEEAALGRRFFPGERIGPLELPPALIEDYEPEGPHPDVHLNNAGLCIDVSGWDLSDV